MAKGEAGWGPHLALCDPTSLASPPRPSAAGLQAPAGLLPTSSLGPLLSPPSRPVPGTDGGSQVLSSPWMGSSLRSHTPGSWAVTASGGHPDWQRPADRAQAHDILPVSPAQQGQPCGGPRTGLPPSEGPTLSSLVACPQPLQGDGAEFATGGFLGLEQSSGRPGRREGCTGPAPTVAPAGGSSLQPRQL